MTSFNFGVKARSGTITYPNIGVIYGGESGIVRRVVWTTEPDESTVVYYEEGEEAICISPEDVPAELLAACGGNGLAAMQHVVSKMLKQARLPLARCALVDPNGNVISTRISDPYLDKVLIAGKDNGLSLVTCSSVNVGDAL